MSLSNSACLNRSRFSVDIFEAAGTKLNSFVEGIIVALVQVVGTVLAMGVIDRAGRRVLLFVSSAVMIVCLIGMGMPIVLAIEKNMVNFIHVRCLFLAS